MFHTIGLTALLYKNGAAFVGFADLSEMLKDELKYGISIGIPIAPDIVESIHDGPNPQYFEAYHALNRKLNELANNGAEYLRRQGFNAFAQTTDAIREDDTYRTKMPHKTVAVAAGLGWIGKSALFVTKEYGSAVRLTSILTNAPLNTGTPCTESKCGSCALCKDACPGRAISGKLWERGMDRDEIYDPFACRKKARELAQKRIQEEITLCGKCIEICPYTQQYLFRNRIR